MFFAVNSEDELKLLLYGIEQRFYTTLVGGERRIANSVIGYSFTCKRNFFPIGSFNVFNCVGFPKLDEAALEKLGRFLVGGLSSGFNSLIYHRLITRLTSSMLILTPLILTLLHERNFRKSTFCAVSSSVASL